MVVAITARRTVSRASSLASSASRAEPVVAAEPAEQIDFVGGRHLALSEGRVDPASECIDDALVAADECERDVGTGEAASETVLRARFVDACGGDGEVDVLLQRDRDE